MTVKNVLWDFYPRGQLHMLPSALVSTWDEMRCLRQAMRDLPYPVDVWVMGEREFEETKHVIGGLAYPAHKYGVVLYELDI